MAELGEKFSERLIRAGRDCLERRDSVDHSRAVRGEHIDSGGCEFGATTIAPWTAE